MNSTYPPPVVLTCQAPDCHRELLAVAQHVDNIAPDGVWTCHRHQVWRATREAGVDK